MGKLVNIVAVAAVLLSGSCGNGDDSSLPADAIVAVGEDVLTAGEVRAAVPVGLGEDDSTAYAQAYIRNWTDRKLIVNVAAMDVDMATIDRLTQEYREELIMNQYRREMVRRADNTEFSQDSMRAYYDAHSSEFILERPLVKGVYLKVPDDSPLLTRIRRLYTSMRPTDIDKLDQAANSAAVHFDYFRDRWVDWEQIESRIPTEFNGDAVAFLRSNRPLEVSAGGYTYLLSISEYMLPGVPMPFEAARPVVRDRLLNSLRRRYDTQLRHELEERALATGQLRYPGSGTISEGIETDN